MPKSIRVELNENDMELICSGLQILEPDNKKDEVRAEQLECYFRHRLDRMKHQR